VIYTSQKEQFVKPLLETYTKASGQEIQFISDSGPVLIERLKAEGAKTSADLLLTVDAGNLWLATQQGLLQPISSEPLKGAIPKSFRDPEGHWYGFSLRARTILYNTSKVKPSELSTYQDLGDKKWKGRLCLRTSKNVYNQSLVALMLADQKPEQVENLVQSWVANLATSPFVDDTKLIEAIAAGQCDVGVANHYYLARLIRTRGELPVAVHWASYNQGGTFVNIFGAGVVKASQKKSEAQKFLEWLGSREGQTALTQNNLEYPVLANIPTPELISKWGTFKSVNTPLIKAGELQAQAVKLMDKVGYK
jgi:iron(III) transport system substrate-binding protein